MPVDPLIAATTAGEVSKDRDSKTLTKLKADTDFLKEMMNRGDCTECHKSLNKKIEEIENKYETAFLKLSLEITTQLQAIIGALNAAVLVPPVPSDGGAAKFVALGTALKTVIGKVNWTKQSQPVLVEPPKTNQDKLYTNAKTENTKSKAGLVAVENATGGKTEGTVV